MTRIALMWLLCPFVLMGILAHHRGALAFLMRVYPAGVVIGGTGALGLVLGTFVLRGPLGLVLYFVGAPLCALAVFSPRPRRDDGDDGGSNGGGGDDHPEDGEDGPPFDWPEFERAFWAHVRRSRQPLPRT